MVVKLFFLNLLHRYRFGKVAGLIDVAATHDGDVVGEKL
jgi:hypothetical protein